VIFHRGAQHDERDTPPPRPPQPKQLAAADRRAGPQWPEPAGVLRGARTEREELSALEAAVGGDGSRAARGVARPRSTARAFCATGWDVELDLGDGVCLRLRRC